MFKTRVRPVIEDIGRVRDPPNSREEQTLSNSHAETSKFLSYVLSHRPDEIGLDLDASGWADVDSLLVCAAEQGRDITLELLEEVVASNDKQRFEFSEDHAMIRARQGHSIKVELGYQPTVPPDVLYHGTADRNIESICQQGLLKGRRHHVHLSGSQETAMKVGKRYGKPVLLTITSGRMHANGLVFYRTGNNVWLTDRVFTQLVGRPPKGFPLVYPVRLTVQDVEKRKDVITTYHRVEVPVERVLSKLGNNTISTIRPRAGQAVAPAAPVSTSLAQLQRKLADLQQRNAQLQAQVKLLKELLGNDTNTPASLPAGR